MSALSLAVLVSGHGSNLQAVLDAIANGRLDASIAAVICNRRDALALERARAAAVPTVYWPLAAWRPRGGRQAYDRALAALLTALDPDLVLCAGWMHILGPAFFAALPHPLALVNLHPAMPGAFPGRDALARSFAAGGDGGVMLHDLTPELDAGPVRAVRTVPRLPDDTLESFAARIHAAEHTLVVEFLQAESRRRQRAQTEAP